VDLDALVSDWLTVPDVAERLGVDVTRVRAMIKEHRLVAVRRGPNGVLSVPALCLDGAAPVKGLPGTLVMLADFGYSDEETVEWLFSVEEGERYAELRGVQLTGTVRLDPDPELIVETWTGLMVKYEGFDSEQAAGFRRIAAAKAATQVALVFEPTQVVSWDHRKLS
jgi:excisionase family DNA binding protein